tara:strand:- start:298 stop:2055 length:1758 start_codon:yes stop_codon:yes gene_type:complete
MQVHLRLYNSYVAKLAWFLKHTIITNILFVGLAYSASNPNTYHYVKISENYNQNYSYLMKKAFEAEILVKNEDYGLAADIYYEICLKSDDPEIARRATQLAGFAKKYNLMLKTSDRWLLLAENKIAVKHVRLSIFLELRKIDLAIKETLSIINSSKDKDRFALVYDTVKVFDDSIIQKIFDSIYNEYQDEYLANFYYVQVLLDNKEYEKVIKIINGVSKFKEFSKKESRWGIFLADAYFQLGKINLCIETIKDYLDKSPKDLYLNQYYVQILTSQKNYQEAISHYRFMAANKLIDFSDIEVAQKMAILNIQAEKYIDADNFINSIKEKNPNIYNYLNGMKEKQKNNYKAAESFFKKIEKKDNLYIDSIIKISEIKIQKKDYAELKKFFKRENEAIKDNQNLEIRLILLETEIFFNEKKYQHSMERIDFGLEKYNNNKSFLYTRALVAEQIGRLDILENDLKKLISLDPGNAQALNALGYTWANKNINLKDANLYIDKALLLEPNDAAILDSKGWVLYRMGEYLKAENYFIRALKLSEDSEIVIHYVTLLLKLNKKEKANKIYLKYLEISPKDKKLIEIKKILNEI